MFRAAKEMAEAIKFDKTTGLHLDDISNYLQEEIKAQNSSNYLKEGLLYQLLKLLA